MTTTARIDAPRRMFNRLFWLTWISYFWALGAGAWSVWLVVQTVLNCLPGAHVALTLPTNLEIPPVSGSVSYSGSAYVLPGSTVTATSVSLIASHLPLQNAILLGASDVFSAATSAAMAWCIYLLMRRLRANEPFAASTARALTAAGLILGIGSTASTFCGGIGHLGLYVAYIAKDGSDGFFASGGSVIEFMPLFFAGVLFALAGVFRYGARLEQERVRLRRETEGLV
jgi:hypothetical protein